MDTSQPPWASDGRAATIAEPFRSDMKFWTSLAASADAVLGLFLAIIAAIVLTLAGQRGWSGAPFLLPALLALRAASVGRRSSERSRASFGDTREWRDAERMAVAASFRQALLRHRYPIS